MLNPLLATDNIPKLHISFNGKIYNKNPCSPGCIFYFVFVAGNKRFSTSAKRPLNNLAMRY